MTAALFAALESALHARGPGSDCPHCRMPARLAMELTARPPTRGRLREDGASVVSAARAYRCHWCEAAFAVRVELPGEW